MPSISAANEAASRSTTYYLPSQRKQKRRRPERSNSPSSESSTTSTVPMLPAERVSLAQSNGEEHTNEAAETNAVGNIDDDQFLPDVMQVFNDSDQLNGVGRASGTLQLAGSTDTAPLRRASSSIYSVDSGDTLYDHPASGEPVREEDDLPFDPQDEYDMDRDTRHFLERRLDEICEGLYYVWDQASLEDRARLTRSLQWVVVGARNGTLPHPSVQRLR
ncbi:hypothetical protein MPH_09544 [Macrophomina phaseolina MS6]|uniref:Uncharacterized protein n=1 Tax=Macrophomina phaseolina (strain MS6) TaxID=1126212 RepID=K2RF73_MACPH|nr:hypothetical protein MPH_09544 [Macrophomina phaseolina MS6]